MRPIAVDPRVARWGYEVDSKTTQGEAYSVGLLIGERGDHYHCDCEGFSWRKWCSHLDDVVTFLAWLEYEGRLLLSRWPT